MSSDIFILNEYCLRQIFVYLDLKDQIAASKTCRLFQEICGDLWSVIFKNLQIVQWNDRRDLKVNSSILSFNDFIAFLPNIAESVEFLDLRQLDRQAFEILKKHTYKRLKNFQITISDLNDNDVSVLTTIFPNLEYLDISGKISGKYLTNFYKLKGLTMVCYYVQFSELEKVLEELELEELSLNFLDSVNSWHFSKVAEEKFFKLKKVRLDSNGLVFIMNLWKFKNLKAITLFELHSKTEFAKFFEVIRQYKVDDVTALEVRYSTYNFTEYKNLQRLVIFNVVVNEDLLHNLCAASELRVLILKFTVFYKSEIIPKILIKCPKLEFLSLEFCSVANLLEFDGDYIGRQRQKRVHLNAHKCQLLSGIKTNQNIVPNDEVKEYIGSGRLLHENLYMTTTVETPTKLNISNNDIHVGFR